MEERDTKDCDFCGEEILELATVCKHCRTDLISSSNLATKKKVPGKSGLAVKLFLVLILVGAIAAMLADGTGSNPSEKQLAVSQAQNIIKDQLSSPSSYKELSSSVVWSGVNSEGLDSHIVKLSYEAKNKFGGSDTGCKWVSFSDNNGQLSWSRYFGMTFCPDEMSSEDLEGYIAKQKERAFGLEKTATTVTRKSEKNKPFLAFTTVKSNSPRRSVNPLVSGEDLSMDDSGRLCTGGNDVVIQGTVVESATEYGYALRTSSAVCTSLYFYYQDQSETAQADHQEFNLLTSQSITAAVLEGVVGQAVQISGKLSMQEGNSVHEDGPRLILTEVSEL